MTGRAPLYRLARELSPQYRRWRRILRQSSFDPDSTFALESPGPRDFIICGSPRSGTALLTAALWQPPALVTVMEPWDALRMPPADLFMSLRAEMAEGELSRGRLDIAALERDGSVAWCRDKQRTHRLRIAESTLVGVKFPAFWRYLDRLPDTRFLVCLRDPVDVIQSYGAAGGRLARGLDYDVSFNARMNMQLLRSTDDDLERRVQMFDYIHERILPQLTRPNVLAVRYERWFEDQDALLSEISDFLDVDAHASRAVVRARTRASDDTRVRHLVREGCRTAQPLGYAP